MSQPSKPRQTSRSPMANKQSKDFVGIAEAVTLIRDIHEDHLNSTEKHILNIGYVSRLGSENYEVWPSDLQVAVNCGVSIRTVRTVKASLMSKAKQVLIETEKGYFDGTTGKPTRVKINFPRLRSWATEDRHRIKAAIAAHKAYETTRKAAQRAKIKGDVPANPAGTRKNLSLQSTTSVPANPASVPANGDICPSNGCRISNTGKLYSEALQKKQGATSKNLNIDFKQEDSTKDISKSSNASQQIAPRAPRTWEEASAAGWTWPEYVKVLQEPLSEKHCERDTVRHSVAGASDPSVSISIKRQADHAEMLCMQRSERGSRE